MTDQEKVFYEDKNLKITNTRAVFSNTTYSLANITSVTLEEVPPNRGGAILLLCIGIVMVLAAFIAMSVDSGFGGLVLGLLGLIPIGFGIYLWLKAKPTYTVRINSASGEIDALKSSDKNFIMKIVNALNQAIVERG